MTVESGKEFSELLICFSNWLMSWLSNLPLWVQLYKSSPRTEFHVHLVLTSECFFRLKTVCSAENRLPKRQKSRIYVCQIGEKWPRQVQTRAFLQPAKAPAMSMAPCAKTCPPPLSHLFPSRKPIFKVDWANWWHMAKVAWQVHSSLAVKWLALLFISGSMKWKTSFKHCQGCCL